MNHRSFSYFGFDHILMLGAIFVITFVLVLLVRQPRFKHWERPICEALFVVLMLNEVTKFIVLFNYGAFDIKISLPLHICNLGVYLCAYSLVKDNQYIWEFAYFWVLAGTLQSLLTPFIAASFPSYQFIAFFISHGGIVIAVIFLAAGCGRVIYRSSVKRVWLFTNVYFLFIYFFNRAIGANYLFMAHKPEMFSIVDYLGPWPIYLIWLEVIFTVSLFIFYLPFKYFKAHTVTRNKI